ncbi:MAG: helix-turn-helix transcriptional regulator, partial [Chloroflexi bacterium]|nr:helix-turn-helix transcriptional regulator [Chloroflexota bacterium]
MPDDLWQIRKRKGLSVGQLATKSGLSTQLIIEYETGKPIPASDRFKLAKALYVFDKDIKPISTPPPVEKKPEPER